MDKNGCALIIIIAIYLTLFEAAPMLFWTITIAVVSFILYSILIATQSSNKKRKRIEERKAVRESKAALQREMQEKGFGDGMYERGLFNHMKVVEKKDFIEVRFDPTLLPTEIKKGYQFYPDELYDDNLRYEIESLSDSEDVFQSNKIQICRKRIENGLNNPDGDFVKKGTSLAVLNYRGETPPEDVIEKYGNYGIELTAPIDGYLIWNKIPQSYMVGNWELKENEVLYYIYKHLDKEIQENASKLANFNYPNIKKDDFSNSITLSWDTIGGSSKETVSSRGVITLSENDEMDLSINLKYHDGESSIYFQTNSKVRINSGDIIDLLFDDNEKIRLIVSKKSYEVSDSFNNRFLETNISLTKDMLDQLITSPFKKWQITFSQTGKKIRGGELNYKFYRKVLTSGYILQYLALDYLKVLEDHDIQLSSSNINTNNDLSSSACSVYLMLDTNTNYYKIGISNKPTYRERTLQSEKPTVELIISKEFPAREIAAAFEKALHNTYASKHIRGEWYNLDEKQLEDIIASLN